MSARVEAALTLAALGWPVFPCVPNGKEPATDHGFKDASTDPDVIRAWWGRMPAANVAVATGQPAVDVLDVDVKGAVDGTAAQERLQGAGLLGGALATVRTPSGGWHVYYRGTNQGNGSMPRHGIDFRGKGGYVLVPPSYVVNTEKGYAGPYVVEDWRQGAPGRALDWQACKRLLDPPRPLQPWPRVAGPGKVSWLVGWVADQPEGNRNAGLFWAACRVIESGHGDELGMLVDAARQAGLPEREARRTVDSALRKLGAR